MALRGTQYKLFDAPTQMDNGLVYRPEFISPEEEWKLLAMIDSLPLKRAHYGEYVGYRRYAGFGWGWDSRYQRFVPGPPLPTFLEPTARKVAKWLGIPRAQVVEALVNEYPPRAAIGWHRDNEGFEHIIGVSLGAWCRMRWRPFYKKDRGEVISLELEPRSAYIMQKGIRWEWQHSVAPVLEPRTSITFRTLPARVQLSDGYRQMI